MKFYYESQELQPWTAVPTLLGLNTAYWSTKCTKVMTPDETEKQCSL